MLAAVEQENGSKRIEWARWPWQRCAARNHVGEVCDRPKKHAGLHIHAGDGFDVRWSEQYAPEVMTPEEVDRLAGDDEYMRHLLFIRFVLGEPLGDAVYMAKQVMQVREMPRLDVATMRRVASKWAGAEDEP